MLDFRPPRDSAPLIALVNLTLPLYMKFALHDTKVQPAPGAIERFEAFRGKRGLICPNHSNRHDPQVMFDFSRMSGERFNYVAAREVFDWSNGFNGWWLQHLGTYSVVRGAADRESFKMTKKILSEGKRKLVLFPEGEISRQNDTLMPLESGAAQLTFWAVEELAKQAAGAAVEPVYIIPIALKYTYPRDIQDNLKETLSSLEASMSILSIAGASVYQRLRAISEKLLETLEREYKMKPVPGADLNERVSTLRQSILTNVGHQLQIELPKNVRQLEMVRILRNHIDDFIYATESDSSEYEKKVHEERAATLRGFYNDLDRVVNFIAIYDGYLKDNLTQERFADILDRLEREIKRTREPSFRGSRIVLLDVGEPINLSERYADYKSAKKATIAKVTEEISGQISDMLVKLDQYRKPIILS
ncbi:MAG TPA: lysophospholipid acyltransferase family protein [Drouetiella sp.]|jgi:Acyltransferase